MQQHTLLDFFTKENSDVHGTNRSVKGREEALVFQIRKDRKMKGTEAPKEQVMSELGLPEKRHRRAGPRGEISWDFHSKNYL